jgi:crinkler effector protein
VTQPVPVLYPTQLLSLNCSVLGDDLKKVFTVKIDEAENVSILKKLIKEEKAPHLDHVAASDLQLWNVSIPMNGDADERLKSINNLEPLDALFIGAWTLSFLATLKDSPRFPATN